MSCLVRSYQCVVFPDLTFLPVLTLSLPTVLSVLTLSLPTVLRLFDLALDYELPALDRPFTCPLVRYAEYLLYNLPPVSASGS
jgi:hypothetical protein